MEWSSYLLPKDSIHQKLFHEGRNKHPLTCLSPLIIEWKRKRRDERRWTGAERRREAMKMRHTKDKAEGEKGQGNEAERCDDNWYIYPPQAVEKFQIYGRTVTRVFFRRLLYGTDWFNECPQWYIVPVIILLSNTQRLGRASTTCSLSTRTRYSRKVILNCIRLSTYTRNLWC